MSAPICRHGHRPVHCQRWRQQPWANVDGRTHRRYWCPICRRFVFVYHAASHRNSKHPKIHRNPWWRFL